MKLFEPFAIGTMSLRNRLVEPPMITNFGTKEGYVTDRTKAYYEARAEGGVGLVIVEATCIAAPIGRISPRQLAIDDDKYIPGLRELTRVIQKHGAKAAIQIHHAGGSTASTVTGHQPVAPSPIPPPGEEMPRELNVDEIKEIVRRFAEAAARAKRAGFDGVEIHAAHRYLLAQFLSRAFNKRQDEYGGDLRNRARIVLDTITAAKEAVGATYPVWCRINGEETRIEGGTTIEEAQETARMCQAAGADAIHVSHWDYGADPSHLPISATPEGHLIPLAEAIKQAVSIPVIAVGRITATLGEEVVKEGKADLIAIGKGLLADPQLPNKAVEARFEDIIPCILCGTCEYNYNIRDEEESLYCRVNPVAGKESESTITKAEKPNRVVVIGGGPAGMEAAIIAARRGHQVTLFDKEERLGGQLLLAAVAPYKDTLTELTKYLSTQVEKADVDVKLGKEASVADIESLSPDAVVLATGCVPLIPEIPGIGKDNVVIAEEVLAGRTQVGERVVVIGGELVGCETAEVLADAGKKVTITRRGQIMAASLAPMNREPLLGRLADKDVTMLTEVRYEEITTEGLVITNKEGRRQIVQADTVVLAAGSRPNRQLLKALERKVPEVYQIGDCVKPRSILEALAEGFHVGQKL